MVNWSLVIERLSEGNPRCDNLYDILVFLYYDKKLSLHQIADLTDGECSVMTLANKMKRLGIRLRKQGGPNNLKVTSIPLKEYKTMSYDQLALKYGVDRTTVYRHVKQYLKTNGKKRGGEVR